MDKQEYAKFIKDKTYCTRLNEFLYYEAISDSKSKNTIKSYSHSVDTFLNWARCKKKLHGLEDIQLKRISRDDLIEYQTKLKIEEFAFASINNKMSAIYEFFRYLEYRNVLKSPYVNIDKLTLPNREMEKLTDKEIDSLLQAIKNDSDYFNNNKVRDVTLFVMAMNTGMRISEITESEIQHIQNTKFKVIGKGNKGRTLFVHGALKEALDIWLKQREKILEENGAIIVNDKGEPTDYIFLNNTGTGRLLSENADKIFKYYGEIAGISKEKSHFHILRHTYASMMIKKVSISMLQKLLGHKYITTTQIYTHMDEEDLEEASLAINIG